MDSGAEFSLGSIGSFDDHDMSGSDLLPPSPRRENENSFDDASRDEGSSLRALLDEMGYYQELSPGSEELVNRLLEDLRGLQNRSNGPGAPDAELTDEVARLTVENNQLHEDLLKEMESHDQEVGAHKARLRALEDELEGFRHMRDPAREDALGRAETAEGRAKELSARLDRALKSAEVALEGGVDPALDRGRHSALSEGSDGTRMLEERIQLLEMEISDMDAETHRLRGENERLTDELSRARSELDHSNAERRLALHQLNTRSETLNSDAPAKQRITSLESQLELLRNHVEELEKDLASAQSAKKALQARYDDHVRKLTEQLKDEKLAVGSLRKELDGRIQEAAKKVLVPRSAPQPAAGKPPKPAPAPAKRTIVPAARVGAANDEALLELKSTKEKLGSLQADLEQQTIEIRELRRTVEGGFLGIGDRFDAKG